MRHTLKREEILRGKKGFDTLFKGGEKIHGTVIRCLVIRNPVNTIKKKPAITVGFTVSRSMKRAVDRNRAKRLIRESYRLNKHLLIRQKLPPQGVTILFIYSRNQGSRPSLPTFQEMAHDMKNILQSVMEKVSR